MRKRNLKFYFELASDITALKRAFRVAIIVGIILNGINNPELFFPEFWSKVSFGRAFLTFLVPFGVSLYSSVMSSASKIKITE